MPTVVAMADTHGYHAELVVPDDDVRPGGLSVARPRNSPDEPPSLSPTAPDAKGTQLGADAANAAAQSFSASRTTQTLFIISAALVGWPAAR